MYVMCLQVVRFRWAGRNLSALIVRGCQFAAGCMYYASVCRYVMRWGWLRTSTNRASTRPAPGTGSSTYSLRTQSSVRESVSTIGHQWNQARTKWPGNYFFTKSRKVRNVFLHMPLILRFQYYELLSYSELINI